MGTSLTQPPRKSDSEIEINSDTRRSDPNAVLPNPRPSGSDPTALLSRFKLGLEFTESPQSLLSSCFPRAWILTVPGFHDPNARRAHKPPALHAICQELGTYLQGAQ